MSVIQEVKQAYADCHMSWERGQSVRNLNFRAGEYVTPAKAEEILTAAIPHGYNSFRAELLAKFPEGTQVEIARESSVALYVRGKNLPSRNSMLADEVDIQPDGSTRYWWD